MAVVVVSPQIEAPCSEMWADPDEIAAELGTPDAEQVAIEATFILWVLSGQKYHGYQTWTEDYLLDPGQRMVKPPRWPVDEILTVSSLDAPSVDAVETALTDWTWDGQYIHLGPYSSGSPFFSGMGVGCATQRLRVVYRIAPFLAPGADRVVKRLASEYWKARCGDKCSLPERITSVTRQGVSWTILDPQDFLVAGRIGIGPIDQWLATVNRLGIVRALDPFYMPTVLRSVQTGCEDPNDTP